MAVVQPIRQQTEDLAAERAVLGAVLADNTVVASVAEVVLADDFSSPAHGQIFAAMLALDGTQRPVDHLTLSEELKTRGQLAGVDHLGHRGDHGVVRQDRPEHGALGGEVLGLLTDRLDDGHRSPLPAGSGAGSLRSLTCLLYTSPSPRDS